MVHRTERPTRFVAAAFGSHSGEDVSVDVRGEDHADVAERRSPTTLIGTLVMFALRRFAEPDVSRPRPFRGERQGSSLVRCTRYE
jgi:hypothetical protein